MAEIDQATDQGRADEVRAAEDENSQGVPSNGQPAGRSWRMPH
jgi:hypothetical protein